MLNWEIRLSFKKFEELVSVKPVGVTMPVLEGIPDAEGLIAFAARVSNPSNQHNYETADKLLSYCAKHGHWSVFDLCNLVLEVKVPRDISRQMIRHSSLKFQEYSGRYAEYSDDMFCLRECRMQDTVNRQNSVKCKAESSYEQLLASNWQNVQEQVLDVCISAYKQALHDGIAKEVARVLLPEGLVMSTMYINGTARNWLHYLGVRTERGVTQEEHCVAADLIKIEFLKHFPSLTKQLETT